MMLNSVTSFVTDFFTDTCGQSTLFTSHSKRTACNNPTNLLHGSFMSSTAERRLENRSAPLVWSLRFLKSSSSSLMFMSPSTPLKKISNCGIGIIILSSLNKNISAIMHRTSMFRFVLKWQELLVQPISIASSATKQRKVP